MREAVRLNVNSDMLDAATRSALQGAANHLRDFARSLDQSSFARYGHLCEVKRDGDRWCVLLGENIQEGVVGFGQTPNEAIKAFDKAMNTKEGGVTEA